MSAPFSSEVVAVLESLADAAVVVDGEGTVVFVNGSAERLFGFDASALLGRPVEVLLPDDLRGRHLLARMQSGLSRESRRMGSGLSLVAQRADGTRVPVDVSLDPIRGGDSELVLACVRDMSEYARLLVAAEMAEDRYRMVVTSASEVFYRVEVAHDSMRGSVSFVSPQCERVTGYAPAAFLASPGLWIECVHPDDRQTLFRTTEEILRNGVESSRYYRLRNSQTGEYRWLADRVVPLHDESGRVTGYQGVARDITERRRAEADRQRLETELRQAQKMEAIGRLAGGVAHDFNNLVTVILASCDAARGELRSSSPINGHLAEIDDAGHRASELTRQLLTLSHAQPNAPRVLDVNAQLNGSRTLFRRMLADDVELRWNLTDAVWPVRLDGSQLDQVLFNLVANARDAMSAGGTLTVSTCNVQFSEQQFIGAGGPMPGDYVRMMVEDTGAGMDGAGMAHAFEPFYTTKRPGEGTGLGLASVYGIVKQNHGEIELDSAPGRGTRVIIHFPRCRATEAAE